MGLSNDFINQHISTWERNLNGLAYPHRAKWPSRLFHHSPLENAAIILRSAKLLSRNDSNGIRVRDVAASSVIDTSTRAHKFVRLYFRPRTPTQYHIEGIRKQGECSYGESSHAPILYMFVLEAKKILAMPKVFFSDSNMQTGAVEQSSEAFFSQIPFTKVYHEGGIGGDTSIIKHRCAEVLAPSPLDIRDYLQWIYCRSEAERDTLIHALGEYASHWSKKIIVSDDLKVFEKRFAFIETVSLSNEGVIFKVNARSDMRDLSLRMSINDSDGQRIGRFRNDSLVTDSPCTNWIAKVSLSPGIYYVKIELEDQLAYEAKLDLNLSPF